MTTAEILEQLEALMLEIDTGAVQFGYFDHDDDPIFSLRGEHVYTLTMILHPAPSMAATAEINLGLQLRGLGIYRTNLIANSDGADTRTWELIPLEDARRILKGQPHAT